MSKQSNTLVLSESASRKVKDPLPIPSKCNICNGEVSLVNNSSIYGRSYGEWPWAYRCDSCGAYVGVHANTLIPLGTLADGKTRNARKRCKPAFNKLWEEGKMTRSKAYAELAKHLGITAAECHFGMFTIQQCNDAKDWAELQSIALLKL